MAGDNPEGGAAIQVVRLDDVLEEMPVASGQEMPPLARVGYKLAKYLLIYLAAVSAILLVDYWFHAPSLPKQELLGQVQIEQYQSLSEISLDRTLKLLDTLVLKGFLPVLTAVLGYIFGTHGVERAEA